MTVVDGRRLRSARHSVRRASLCAPAASLLAVTIGAFCFGAGRAEAAEPSAWPAAESPANSPGTPDGAAPASIPASSLPETPAPTTADEAASAAVPAPGQRTNPPSVESTTSTPTGASSDDPPRPPTLDASASAVPRYTDAGVNGALPPLQFHGFVSQGYIKSTDNNYLVASKRGSFEFTEIGLNATQQLTDRLRTGIQFFARQLGKVGDYRARIDWFYLDYRFADWLGVRAGRTKMPFGLYNEVSDVDSARVPILMPQSTYPILNRDLLLALTGIDLYGYLSLGAAGGLDYRAYGGTLYIDTPAPPPGLTLVDYAVPYVVGARLLWDSPVSGLRVGGSAQALRINSHFAIPGTMGMPATPLNIEIPFVLWLLSAEYTGHDLVLAAEYGRWHAHVEATGQPTKRVENERFYGSAAYRIVPWFTPCVYYSSLVPNVDKRSGQENYQHDWATTFRFDINPFWLVKLEGHYIRGTNDLSSALNDNKPLSMLAPHWFLFMVKTTAYF